MGHHDKESQNARDKAHIGWMDELHGLEAGDHQDQMTEDENWNRQGN
jgi:hypothetical protein